MTRTRLLFLAGAVFFVTACGHKTRVAHVPRTPGPVNYSPETGVASWYGPPFHGRQTASGEIYDMEQMTAAHRTLPFGTVVHVDNLDNGMSTEVRITDRGPFVNNRIIDLSHAAARTINMLGPGTANVRLTIVRAPVAAPGVFVVQFAAVATPEAAEHLRAEMQARYGAALVRQRPGNPPLWRVLVGQASDIARAEELARQIRSEQNAPKAFVIRLDPSPN